jgi:hypothetical protein
VAALIDALLRTIPDAVEIEDVRHLIIDPQVPAIPESQGTESEGGESKSA